MKAIVLVGGFGTRIEEIAQGRPKTLLEVYDKTGKIQPIFHFILDKINETNLYGECIDGIVVVTNEKYHKQMQKSCKEYKTKNPLSVEIQLFNDGTTCNENRLGANGDLLWIRDQMDKHGINYDEVMIIAGDNYFDFDLIDVIDEFDKKTLLVGQPTIIVAKEFGEAEVENARKGFAMLKVGENNMIQEMVEKPATRGIETDSNLGAIALYVTSGRNFCLIEDFIKENANDPKARDALGYFGSYLMKHTPAYAWTWEGKFVDIGTVQAYKELWADYEKTFGVDPEIIK